MQTDILAIDFGTSNSAAATASETGEIRRIPIERGAETLPTAVFFPAEGGAMRIGADAASALIDGDSGRYMRALKSVLGDPLLQEPRLVGGRRRTLSDIITDFLTETRRRAEAATGQRFRRVLSGRPVRFHPEAGKDVQAEADLRACYLAAGFEDVAFLPEPAAAAIASHGLGRAEDIGLIVDIGGGTSDFSVFRSVGDEPDILANHGVRLGGADFDHAVAMTHAMPLLGLGGQMRREMGQELLPVPPAIYSDLATWAKIPFLYTPKTVRMAAEMAKLALDRPRLERLVTVLDQQLGHELAFAVERGKIDANGDQATGRIEMGFIEPALSGTVTAESLDAALTDKRANLHQAALDTLHAADVAPDKIGRVILVGGSSLMRFVQTEMRSLCPNAEILRSEAFTAVVDGLALAER